jgi:UDP-N-acetylglucosamine 2-epimerase (non-hydrolysing)
MHIVHVVGARPNFMKAAPVIHALNSRSVRQTLVHTGQHYDAAMSDIFFQQLGLPDPDVNLGVGSGSHAQQTAAIITGFERVMLEYKPDMVVVYGDVNSTLAAVVVASKLGVPVSHVEAGLRSFDRTMPEEINRLVTDQLSDLLFTPSLDGNENLAREGVSSEKVHFVGNVMIDTLIKLLPAADQVKSLDLPEKYLLVTLHRAANVDDLDWIRRMLSVLADLSKEISVVFPVHPRTKERILQAKSAASLNGGLRLLDPVPYLEFLNLQKRATAVITDSGGIQEETTYLGVPCLTVRDNTERPVTISMGTNVLVGRSVERVQAEVSRILKNGKSPRQVPDLWDGHAGERIADIIVSTRA